MVSFYNLPCSCSFLEPNHFFPIGILILPMYCYGQNSFRAKIMQKKSLFQFFIVENKIQNKIPLLVVLCPLPLLGKKA